MPTKAQSNNAKNLVSLAKRTTKEQREIAKKGGIASGEARREKKIMKDEILKRLTEKDWDEMILNAIERAKSNSKDLEVLRDTIGQKPITEIEANVDLETVIKVGITND